MNNLIKTAKDELFKIITNAVTKAISEGKLPESDIPNFLIEIPADKTHGDFATNVAMAGARAFKMAPAKIAEIIGTNFSFEGTYFDRYEIAGPGFINFFLNGRWFCDVIKTAIDAGENYGRLDIGKGKKIMVEFVSANPTGPMHMGNARGGALGDVLAATLSFAGYEATREFYINDAGNQIEKFGMSLSVRYLQHYKGEDAVILPEDAYQGLDIKERAEEYIKEYGDVLLEKSEEERRLALIEFALPKNVQKLKDDLSLYRINYDVWFSEKTLHTSGAIARIIDVLRDKGAIYEKDGAIWYKATDFGSEKDEVLIRANGNPTYFAADIAYHYNKFAERGFDRVINVWGADHHGHIARLKGAMDAIGLCGDNLDIVLMQLVKLVSGGQVVKMSKRSGKAITLTNLIEDVPLDAARFFFNLREPNSTLEFDLDLAVEQSSQNPVYYVQYAHARICSIFKALAAEGVEIGEVTSDMLAVLTSTEERELIRHIATLPNEIYEVVKNYDPSRLTKYVIEVATRFHKFYNAHRVKGESEEVAKARLALCKAVNIVIENVFKLLCVTAPESM